MSLLASVSSRFTTVAVTYFSSDIDQYLVPPFVSTCSSDGLRYTSGGSTLSHDTNSLTQPRSEERRVVWQGAKKGVLLPEKCQLVLS